MALFDPEFSFSLKFIFLIAWNVFSDYSIFYFYLAQHWSPKAPTTEDDDDEHLEDKDIVDNVFAAQPMKKKEKKGLDLSHWRELVDGKPTTSYSVNQKQGLGIMPKPSESGNYLVVPDETAESRLMAEGVGIYPYDVDTSASVLEQFQSVSRTSTMDIHQKESLGLKSHHPGQSSMTEDIDRENLIRLSQMSPQEIAEAQAEINEKMNPGILKMLKKRGHDRSRSRRAAASVEMEKPDLKNDNLIKYSRGSEFESSDFEGKSESAAVSAEKVPSGVHDSGSWKSWCERVEKARDLRFTLDGNVIFVDTPMELKDGMLHNVFFCISSSPMKFMMHFLSAMEFFLFCCQVSENSIYSELQF